MDLHIRIVVLVGIALNAASAWYLARPRFLAFAQQYRLEQDQAAAQRAAQRAIGKSTDE